MDYIIKQNLIMDTLILLEIKSKDRKVYYYFKEDIMI